MKSILILCFLFLVSCVPQKQNIVVRVLTPVGETVVIIQQGDLEKGKVFQIQNETPQKEEKK